MFDYGIVRSTIEPEAKIIDEKSVWINTDITFITEEEFNGYEYHQIKYNKDEYIAELEIQITNTQLALCDVYELIGG